jgi:type I restriction enzyme S subunit
MQIQSKVKEKHLVQTRARDILIPLAPLTEQQRIVARVKVLMERVREAKGLRAETQEDTERLLEVALIEVFSQAEMKGWGIRSFSEVWSEKASYGSFKKPSDEETSYPVIRVGNVINGLVVFDDLKFLSLEKQELPRCQLLDGDLVIARAIGSRAHLGKSAVFRNPRVDKTFVLDSHLIRVRLDKTIVYPDYVRYYLSSSIGRDSILRNSRQSAIQFNINVNELSAVRVPVPRLSDQRSIIDYLDKVEVQAAALKLAQEDTNAELRRLEQAILDRGFRGDL